MPACDALRFEHVAQFDDFEEYTALDEDLLFDMSGFGLDGKNIELIDLRTIYPFDIDAIEASVRKTGRCVVVHEAPLTCGFGAEISARIMERCFLHLEAPVQRVAGFDTIMPYYKLELDYMPDAARVGRAIDDALAY